MITETLLEAPMIEVVELSKRYRRVRAADGVSLAVQRGEIFGLLGPDGAGKSTIIQVLAGVLLPRAGRAAVAGIDVLRDPEAVKARIGYMPQGLGLNLYDDLTVDEHLRFFAELRGLSRPKFEEHRATLLEITRLASVTNRLARHLSGGMRQKLGLVCALIHLPDVVLLDEPTTGVDPLSRRDFWQIIGRLSAEQSITVLLTTPYLDEAERCHRVALMNRGRLLAIGTPQEIKMRLPAAPNGSAPTLEDVFVALVAQETQPPSARSPVDHAGASETTGDHAHPHPLAPAIEVQGLTKRFGEVTAVDAITFSVRPDEIFGFLGPNGAGKTTTIKMLNGILRPTAGAGRVGGYDILRQAGEIKRHIGYMSQRFSLYPDLTVAENLSLYARIYGLSGRRKHDREAAVVAASDLAEWTTVLARDLPLGIRQRLALAAALLHEPRILFLDEPTSGVDPVARRQFWQVISGLSHDEGAAILLSTHYMSEAEHCDRLALIHQGRLVSLGTPEALRQEAEARRGQVLEVTAAAFSEAAAALEPLYPDLALFGRRVHVFTRDPEEDRSRILASLARAGVAQADVRQVPMVMDDVFATFVEGAVADRAIA